MDSNTNTFAVCPNCQKQAFSFMQFARELNPMRMRCHNCKTLLSLDKKALQIIFVLVILFFTVGFTLSGIADWFAIPLIYAMIGLVVITFTIGMPLEYLLWKKSKLVNRG